MEFVSNRLKTLGFLSKRKSTLNFQANDDGRTPANTTTNDISSSPLRHNSSTTSLPRNSQHNPTGAPSSYSSNAAARTTSPATTPHTQLAHQPSSTDTAQRQATANRKMPAIQSSGHGMYASPPATVGPPHGYTRPAEVDGGGRSKAQLIVGIDFVRFDSSRPLNCPDMRSRIANGYYFPGDNLFGSRIRFCNQHRGQGRHYYRMARRRQPNQAKGLSTARNCLERLGCSPVELALTSTAADSNRALLRPVPKGRRVGARHRGRPRSNRLPEAWRDKGGMVQTAAHAFRQYLHRSN